MNMLILGEVGGLPLKDKLSVLEDVGPVREPQGLLHILLHQQDGHTLSVIAAKLICNSLIS